MNSKRSALLKSRQRGASSLTVNQYETAEYVADLVGSLSHLASQNDLPALATLLDAIAREANAIGQGRALA